MYFLIFLKGFFNKIGMGFILSCFSMLFFWLKKVMIGILDFEGELKIVKEL